MPPGQKRVKEDWEDIWVYGMGGSLLLGAIIAIYKPDTRQEHSKFLQFFAVSDNDLFVSLIAYYSLQSWAKREAERRLEERGEDLTYPMTEKTVENSS